MDGQQLGQLKSVEEATERERPRERTRKFGLAAAFVERGNAARCSLDEESVDASPGERILHEFVGQEVAIASAVMDAQAEIATRFAYFLDEPQQLMMLTRALKELTSVAMAIGKRVEGALTTASSLRAQRRLWNLHGGARSR